MTPLVAPISRDHPEPAVIAEAVRRLRNGELVVFPTETVYGLGADALNPEAVERIYRAKGRPAWNPVISHVADIDGAQRLCREWPAGATRLAEAFWPGPLTMVLPRHARVPDIATAGLDAVALRIPDHPVALALLAAFGGPVAAPSANRFTQVSPTTAAHVVASLGDRVDYVLDGGACDVGIESTVVDMSGAVPLLLRPGAITREQLETILETPVERAPPRRSPAHESPDSVAVPRDRAPGGADRHYAPHADVWLLDTSNAIELTAALQSASLPRDNVVALLVHAELPTAPRARVVRMPADAAMYARILYRELHAADASGAALIIIERPPDTEAWSAVHDRLSRASYTA